MLHTRVAFVVVAAAHAEALRRHVVGADRHVAETGVLQPEVTVVELIRSDPAADAERQRFGRHEVHLPDEPVTRAIREVVVPHLRLLADLHERRFIQAGTAAIAVLVPRAEVHPPETGRVCLELQDVLVGRRENAMVVPVVVVRVGGREGRLTEAGPRGLGVERVAIVRDELRTAGRAVFDRRVVVDELWNRRLGHVVVVVVAAEPRAETPDVGRARHQADVRGNGGRRRVGRRTRQRELRQRSC